MTDPDVYLINFRGTNQPQKKKQGTYLPTFFKDFLRFSGLILENIFMVFLGSPCRETAKKRDKQIEGEMRQEKRFFSFFGRKFLTSISPKTFV
jgi:hypothetical protein